MIKVIMGGEGGRGGGGGWVGMLVAVRKDRVRFGWFRKHLWYSFPFGAHTLSGYRCGR